MFEARLKKSGTRCDAVVVKSTRTASSVGTTPANTRVIWKVEVEVEVRPPGRAPFADEVTVKVPPGSAERTKEPCSPRPAPMTSSAANELEEIPVTGDCYFLQLECAGPLPPPPRVMGSAEQVLGGGADHFVLDRAGAQP